MCCWHCYSISLTNLSTISLHAHAVPPTPVNLTAAATADGASIVASWGWNCGLLRCLYKVQVVYQPKGSNETVLHLTDHSATSATLQNLQPKGRYTIYVRTIGVMGTMARTENVTLLLGGRTMYSTQTSLPSLCARQLNVCQVSNACSCNTITNHWILSKTDSYYSSDHK